MRAPLAEELTPQRLEPRPLPPGLTERDLGHPDLEDLTPPDSVPKAVGLFVDDLNRVWARLLDPALTDGIWYDVFDSDGRYLGPVRLPIRFTPLEIGRDYVLGVAKDELDVEYIELYDLVSEVSPP